MADAAKVDEWRDELDRALSSGDEQLFLFAKSLGDAEVAEIAQRLRGSDGNAVRKLFLGFNDFGDHGAAAIAELLCHNGGGGGGGDNGEYEVTLEVVSLQNNAIGRDGIEALAGALKHNNSVRELGLEGNPAVNAFAENFNNPDVVASIDYLVSAIGVNTTLEIVSLGGFNPRQEILAAALADVEGRARNRERFLSGPLTKAARTN
jgi:Leucine Rich repeat